MRSTPATGGVLRLGFKAVSAVGVLLLLLVAVGIGLYIGKPERLGSERINNVNSGKNNEIKQLPQNRKEDMLAKRVVLPTSAQPSLISVPLGSVNELIAQFELSGDLVLLDQIQKKFPDNPAVIMLSCLLATKPDSECLSKLEKLQSNNRLPNLIRAGLYANSGDLVRFARELTIAASKTELDTDLRNRQAQMIDLALSGKGAIPTKVFSSTDLTFFGRLESIVDTFQDHSNILAYFGDEFSAASTTAVLAGTFRTMKDLNFRYAMYGDGFEYTILSKLRNNYEYDGTGKTVTQRRQELVDSLNESEKIDNQLRKQIFSNTADQTLRLQYFIRLRADGENAANAWLLSKAAK